MTVSLNAVEVFWIGLNLATAILTLGALASARQKWSDLRQFNGSARGVVARSNVAAETIRLYIQIAMLLIAVPSALRPGDIAITPGLLLFLTVPVALFANTMLARRVRMRLDAKLDDEVLHERAESLARMEARLNARADERAGVVTERADDLQSIAKSTEAKVDANTALTRQANDNALGAFHEANNLNERLAAQDIKIIAQGEHAAADRLTGQDTNETAHRIDERTASAGNAVEPAAGE